MLQMWRASAFFRCFPGFSVCFFISRDLGRFLPGFSDVLWDLPGIYDSLHLFVVVVVVIVVPFCFGVDSRPKHVLVGIQTFIAVVVMSPK